MNGPAFLNGPISEAYQSVLSSEIAATPPLALTATDTTQGKSCSQPLACKPKPPVKKAPAKKAPAKKKADAGWIPVQTGWTAPPTIHL